MNNGRLNKTPKTPKTTKTATGGARIGRIRSRRFLCVFIQLFVQKEKSERISHLEDTVRIILIWSSIMGSTTILHSNFILTTSLLVAAQVFHDL